jgi:hypothetical protein
LKRGDTALPQPKKMLSWINSKNLPFHITMKRKMFLCSFKVGITDFPDLLRENLSWIIKFYCWSASSNICTYGREWKNMTEVHNVHISYSIIKIGLQNGF